MHVAKRPTPIERAIAGEPLNRQKRYEKRLQEQGIVRVTVMVPRDRVSDLKQHAASLMWNRDARDD
jgi:hypothetical protein